MVCADVGVAERLLSLGADLHATDDSNRNALIHACAAGYIDVASFLLQLRADPDPCASLYGMNEESYVNDTPLTAACRNNHPGIVDLLLAPGNCPKVRLHRLFMQEGEAMDYAIRNASISMVSALLAAGARFEPDTHGMPPLYSQKGRAVARLLLDVMGRQPCRFGDDALFYACRNGHCAMIE
jgi:ankyrin repeat protein